MRSIKSSKIVDDYGFPDVAGDDASSVVSADDAPPVWSAYAAELLPDLYCATQILRARVAILQSAEKQRAQIEASFLLALKRLMEEKTRAKRLEVENKALKEKLANLKITDKKLKSESMRLRDELTMKDAEIAELSDARSSRRGPRLSPHGHGPKSQPIAQKKTLTKKKKKKRKHAKRSSIADLVIAGFAKPVQSEDGDTSKVLLELDEPDDEDPKKKGTDKTPAVKKRKKGDRKRSLTMGDIVVAKSFAAKWAKRGRARVAKKKQESKTPRPRSGSSKKPGLKTVDEPSTPASRSMSKTRTGATSDRKTSVSRPRKASKTITTR
jgi:hypothetical protein